MEIRADKRWLEKRRKELAAAAPTLNQIAELAAVERGIKAMRTVRGEATFRQQLKQGIVIVGSLAGGTGSPPTPGLLVTAMPRKKAKTQITGEQAPLPQGVCIPLGASGRMLMEALTQEFVKKTAKKRTARKGAAKLKLAAKAEDVRIFKAAAECAGRLDDRVVFETKVKAPRSKTGTRKRTPPKGR